jgi:hypothetical protein
MSAMAAGDAPRVKKVMTQAINLLFELLKNRERVEIWLYENTSMKIEGILIVSNNICICSSSLPRNNMCFVLCKRLCKL